MNKPKAPGVAVDPLREDFRNFLFIVWKHLNLREPTRRQYEIAHYMQHGPKRMMVRGFRGVAKSWIACAFVCWLLYCDPQLNILTVSASKGKADEFTRFVQRLISEIPQLRHLVPGQDKRWSSVSFDVALAEADPNPSVKSAGITGQITGTRADIIIPDDIETLDNALTPNMREKLADKVKEFDSILKPLPTSRIMFLGTPQTEQSIYDELPGKGYDVRIFPARYPNEKQRSKYGSRLAAGIAAELDANPALVGKSTDERFSDMDLAEREASIGRSTFLLQFMLDTSGADADRFPLKLRDLLVMHLDPEVAPERCIWAAAPEWEVKDLPIVGIPPDRYYRPVPLPGHTNYQPYTGAVMVIDPAGTGSDETGYAVLKTLNGYLFLLDAGGFPPGRGHAEETLGELARIAAKFKVNKVIIEANFGDGMFTKLLQPHLQRIYPVSCEDVKHNVQKERRICDTLEPVIQSHRLVVNAKLVQQDVDSTLDYSGERTSGYQLFYQLTRVNRERGALAHDDRLDALAIGVSYFSKVMATDSEKKAAEARQRALEDDLKNFMNHALGRPRPAPMYAYRLADDR